MTSIRGKTYGDVAEYQSDAASAKKVKVLVPLDGSSLAEKALEYLDVASALGPLHPKLLSVLDVDDLPVPPEGDVMQEADRQSGLLDTYLRDRALEVSQHADVVDYGIERGPISATILESAEAFRPDLLLISTHGRSGLQRWRIGSVADKVIRHAGCDTLVVGPQSQRGPDGITSVLVPLDGSAMSEAALPVARTLAEGLGAELHIVRVIEPQHTFVDYEGFGYSVEVLAASEEATRYYLEQVAKQLPQAITAAPFGPPATALGDYIEQNGIGLVVMTSHGRGGLLRAALGSVTDRLIGGTAPVYVVHPKPD